MYDSESSPPDLKALSLSVSFPGWRKATSAFKSWATKMSLLHKPTWQKAGILEAVMASTKGFNKDTDLVLRMAERWCPDTNTFLFPWGEATVTLEDVMVLLGFSVLGSPVFAAVDGSGEKTVGKLEKEWVKIKKDNKVSFVTQVTWMGRFMDSGDELEVEVEHAAFLGLWLSYFVFPTRYCHVDKAVLPIALHLSRGSRIALASCSCCSCSPVWTWERFRELRPNNTNQLRQGDPRLALWDEAKQKTMRSNVRKMTKSNVREILANSKMESFEWRPYTKAVKNWKIPQFYPEKAMWVPVGPDDLDEEFISFARCIKVSELVGMDIVEHYFPNRVASQFGLLQDVPCHVNRNNLFKEAAWDEYTKPMDGLTLYIPSRSVISCFTSMFCEWWRKGSPVVESLTPRNIIRGSDHDTSEHVPSGSKKRKLVKRVCKKDETRMDLYQTQVPSEKKQEDDSLTISQVMRSRKKNTAAMCSSTVVPLREVRAREDGVRDAAEAPGKRNHRREADNKGSWIRQKIAYEDETVATLKIKQRSEEEEEETGNKAGKNMVLSSANGNNSSDPPLGANGGVDIVVSRPKTRNCDDEVDVNGIKAEKEKTIVAGGTKEAKCVIHEDGENQRSSEKEDDGKSLKQTNLAIDEISLSLEARMVKVEKTLAKIREWKTIERNNQDKNGITA
ncbi:BnaA06g02270D [Brassica napus]|uniref:(rape) hypothetical protein n=1 Tax=Brassica napus TaxID=3708 RepID=A0A078G8T5_BRANA|nr:unnamed protein product [Brassica napus]CDY22850.1 BnaA06g02270D [Brassica napus]